MGRGADIDLAERARGMMVGIAVGNLFGLHWEGRWQELREEQARRGPVREIYAREGFPDDDDLAQAILLAEACLESGHLDTADLAQRFWIWGETNGVGMGGLTRAVLERYGGKPPYRALRRRFSERQRDAPREPTGVAGTDAARLAWEDHGGVSAGNGSVMRCGAVALRWMHDDEALARNSVTSAAVTHWDQRCVWSTLLTDFTIAACLRGHPLGRDAPVERCTAAVRAVAPNLSRTDLPDDLPDDVRKAVDAAFAPGARVDDLHLGEPRAAGYAPKAMSAALWASQHPTSVEEGLVAVMNAGGDTDSNSPPAGAVLGARFGLEGIPARWRKRVAEIRSWVPDDTDGWIERYPLEEYADRLLARLEDMPKFESVTVNPGFVPEGLAFWRRWRHPKPKPA